MASKSKVFVGVEALTMVRPEGSDAPTIYVYAGAPVPAGADAADVKRLVDEGYLEEQDAPDDAGNQKPTTIQGILDEVGDDKALAQQYLDEENAATSPRTTLVEKLQAIVAA